MNKAENHVVSVARYRAPSIWAVLREPAILNVNHFGTPKISTNSQLGHSVPSSLYKGRHSHSWIIKWRHRGICEAGTASLQFHTTVPFTQWSPARCRAALCWGPTLSALSNYCRHTFSFNFKMTQSETHYEDVYTPWTHYRLGSHAKLRCSLTSRAF